MRAFFIKNIFHIFEYISASLSIGIQRKNRKSKHFSRFYSYVYSYGFLVNCSIATATAFYSERSGVYYRTVNRIGSRLNLELQ
jgi:hypothetical protein